MNSMGTFFFRMFRRKYFDGSNRWYVPALRVRKMAIADTNVSVMKVVFFFFFFSLCNLSESVRKSNKWFRGV